MDDVLLLNLSDIERRLSGIDVVSLMEEAFAAFSQNRSVIPLPGELLFDSPPGEVHIKYGYYVNSDTYVVKIASSFWNNPQRGLNSSDGLMLVFDKETGALRAILCDRGRLTDIRTAAAGAVAAKHLAVCDPEIVGVIGTGLQAELQVALLQTVLSCRKVAVWGRNPKRTAAYAERLQAQGFNAEIARSPAEVAAQSKLIITATAS